MEKETTLWKNRDFMILWSGQTISTFGSQISQIVFPLLILSISKSPLDAGIGSALSTLPTLLFGLIAGVLVDRWDRKKVMIYCDIGRAFVMLSIPVMMYFGSISIIQLYFAAFIEGTLSVFFVVAQVAAVAYIIPKTQITEALSQSEVGYNLVSTIGPSIGGFLYQAVGKTIPYLFDSVSYIISVISLKFIKSNFQTHSKTTTKLIHLDIAEGISWLWHHRTVRLLAILTAGGALAGTAQNLLIILIAQRLGANALTIGYVFSIASIGGILGAIFAQFNAKKFKLHRTIVWGRCLIALTYSLLFFAVNPILLGVIVGLYYAVGSVYGTVSSAYRIKLIPDQLQGRVTSVFRTILFIGLTIGSILGGYISQTVGINFTLYIMCLLLIFLAIVATIYFKHHSDTTLELK